ncbi:MAG: response regulator [Planctomycetota bacterium]|nr:response regulator [Planctomycetota bacterium]
MKILSVDDDQTTRSLLKMILKGAGHQVEEAASASAAHALLETAKFDLIVADMHMPDATGLEMLRELRKDPRTAKTHVIFCTADATRNTVVEAANLGVSAYILKPINSKDVLEKVALVAKAVPPFLEASERVIDRLGIGVKGYREMLRMLVESYRQHIEQLSSCLQDDKMAQFDRTARSLSGAAANLGASALKDATDEACATVPSVPEEQRARYLRNLSAEVERIAEFAGMEGNAHSHAA